MASGPAANFLRKHYVADGPLSLVSLAHAPCQKVPRRVSYGTAACECDSKVLKSFGPACYGGFLSPVSKSILTKKRARLQQQGQRRDDM